MSTTAHFVYQATPGEELAIYFTIRSQNTEDDQLISRLVPDVLGSSFRFQKSNIRRDLNMLLMTTY